MSIVAVGSVAYDSIRTASDSRERILGGSATYFSIAASRFTDVRVVAVIGEDFRQSDVQLMQTCGVDTDGIERVMGKKTFFWSGEYSADFTERTTLATELNVFEDFQPKLSDLYRKSPFIFLANIQPKLQLQVLDQVENPEFVACDTMNLWINTALEDLKQVMKRVDLLTINDEEAYLLTGIRNIHSAAEKILAMGPKYLIIKRGEFGCALYGPERTFLLPAYPVKNVVDPTGAGDSFAGGMMGYLAKADTIGFRELKRAAVTGTVLAGFTVEDFSVDRLVSLGWEEIRARRDEFSEITRWGDLELSKP